MAAIWHSDGGLAVSREWIDIWTQAAASPRTAKLESGAWTGDAATVPVQVSTCCACGRCYDAGRKLRDRAVHCENPADG